MDERADNKNRDDTRLAGNRVFSLEGRGMTGHAREQTSAEIWRTKSRTLAAALKQTPDDARGCCSGWGSSFSSGEALGGGDEALVEGPCRFGRTRAFTGPTARCIALSGRAKRPSERWWKHSASIRGGRRRLPIWGYCCSKSAGRSRRRAVCRALELTPADFQGRRSRAQAMFQTDERLMRRPRRPSEPLRDHPGDADALLMLGVCEE